MKDLIDFREKLYATIEGFKDLNMQGKKYAKTIDVIRMLARMVRYIDRSVERRYADRTMEDW